jgi:hypothetical protein
MAGGTITKLQFAFVMSIRYTYFALLITNLDCFAR